MGLIAAARARAWATAKLFCYSSCYVVSVEFIKFGSVPLDLAVLLDIARSAFLFTVSTIAAAVLLFSYSYIRNEKFNTRFHALVCLFVASMVLLIIRPNLLIVLLG